MDSLIIEGGPRLRGKINAIQVIDCDGSLNDHHTSTHNPMGEGNIDFPPVMKELAANSGTPHNWWTIDLCFWPNAWPATKKCKQAVDKLNALVDGKRAPAKAAKSSASATMARARPARTKPAARKKQAAKKSGGRGKRR